MEEVAIEAHRPEPYAEVSKWIKGAYSLGKPRNREGARCPRNEISRPPKNPSVSSLSKREIYRRAIVLPLVTEHPQSSVHSTLKSIEDYRSLIIRSIVDRNNFVGYSGDRRDALLYPILFVLDGHHHTETGWLVRFRTRFQADSWKE